jgi:hypothetical protein
MQCPADKADAPAPQCAAKNMLPVFCPKKNSWGYKVSPKKRRLQAISEFPAGAERKRRICII